MNIEDGINDRSHEHLEVWKENVDFFEEVYADTESFPRDEEFGLKSQIRRAAVSVPSNIAEGLTRRPQNERLHFLNIAQASLSEMDTQIEISRRLEYIDSERFQILQEDLVRIHKLLGGLIPKMRG